MITIKVMRHSDAAMMGSYRRTTKMDRLGLNASLPPNDVIRKLLNLNETPLKCLSLALYVT